MSRRLDYLPALVSRLLIISPLPCSAKWPGFHTSAEQSKGVGQVSHRNVEPVKEENVEKVDQCIQQAMADYDYLRGFAKGPSV